VEGVLEAFMSDRLDEPQYCSPGIGGEKLTPPQDRSEPAPHVGSPVTPIGYLSFIENCKTHF
jgi:hypothetical protein